MYSNRYLIVFSLVFLQFILSCKSQPDSTWLIKTETEEITVSEAGNLWNELDTSLQTRLSSEDNPIGSYLSYLSREVMIEQVLKEENILNSVEIINLKSCWLTSASARALTDSLTVDILARITEDDITKYRQLLGKTIWYSKNDQHFGPLRLPDLPWEIAFVFDSINPGEHFNFNGSTFFLDSLIMTPAFLENEMGRDAIFIKTNLARSRVNRQIDSFQSEICSNVLIDSVAVDIFLNNRNSLQNTTALVNWSGGFVSSEQADGILAFNALHRSPDSLGFQHISGLLTNQIKLIIQEDIFADKYPSAYSNLIEQAEYFAHEQARQLLFKKHITDHIIITEQMLLDAYNNQNNLPTTPETRIFNSVITTTTDNFSLVNGRLVTINQTASDSISGYKPTLKATNNTLSEPVTARQLPALLANVLFEPETPDSLWYGPLQLQDSTYIYYSLVSIIPEHSVSFEIIRESIQQNLILHIEEQKEAEWMCNLEAHCKLDINLDVLTDLPENPMLWSNF